MEGTGGDWRAIRGYLLEESHVGGDQEGSRGRCLLLDFYIRVYVVHMTSELDTSPVLSAVLVPNVDIGGV